MREFSIDNIQVFFALLSNPSRQQWSSFPQDKAAAPSSSSFWQGTVLSLSLARPPRRPRLWPQWQHPFHNSGGGRGRGRREPLLCQFSLLSSGIRHSISMFVGLFAKGNKWFFFVFHSFIIQIYVKSGEFLISKNSFSHAALQRGRGTSFQLSPYPFHSHTKRRRRKKTTALLYVRYILFFFHWRKKGKEKMSHYICEKKMKKGPPKPSPSYDRRKRYNSNKVSKIREIMAPPVFPRNAISLPCPTLRRGGNSVFRKLLGNAQLVLSLLSPNPVFLQQPRFPGGETILICRRRRPPYAFSFQLPWRWIH